MVVWRVAGQFLYKLGTSQIVSCDIAVEGALPGLVGPAHGSASLIETNYIQLFTCNYSLSSCCWSHGFPKQSLTLTLLQFLITREPWWGLELPSPKTRNLQ